MQVPFSFCCLQEKSKVHVWVPRLGEISPSA